MFMSSSCFLVSVMSKNQRSKRARAHLKGQLAYKINITHYQRTLRTAFPGRRDLSFRRTLENGAGFPMAHRRGVKAGAICAMVRMERLPRRMDIHAQDTSSFGRFDEMSAAIALLAALSGDFVDVVAGTVEDWTGLLSTGRIQMDFNGILGNNFTLLQRTSGKEDIADSRPDKKHRSQEKDTSDASSEMEMGRARSKRRRQPQSAVREWQYEQTVFVYLAASVIDAINRIREAGTSVSVLFVYHTVFHLVNKTAAWPLLFATVKHPPFNPDLALFFFLIR
ncbi:hypothetical protein C0J52_14713 [Blattella germanica]|nr:hypothetical protein C0J52_14713 [Blattella germanica]